MKKLLFSISVLLFYNSNLYSQCFLQLTSKINPSCYGDCTGSADITSAPVTKSFTYSWSPGGMATQDISAVCAGTYVVQATEITTSGNPCVVSLTVTLTQPPQLNASATATDATCLTCTDGSAMVMGLGGTSPYQYFWLPGGQSSASVSGLSPGTYYAIVFDAKGCSDTDMVVINSPTAGIMDHNSASKLIIYPNPVTEGSVIRFSDNSVFKNAEFILFDLTGRQLLKASIPNNEKEFILYVNTLNSGIYLYTIVGSDNNISITGKFMVE